MDSDLDLDSDSDSDSDIKTSFDFKVFDDDSENMFEEKMFTFKDEKDSLDILIKEVRQKFLIQLKKN